MTSQPATESVCGKPWEEKRKTYIGLKKTKLIFELDAAKVPASTIASDLDIDVATVYRHLQTKHGKRKSGRKAKPRGSKAANGTCSDPPN
ncbi:MAG: hypothetical protein K8R36_13010 [Planctomycetales bacterium]|nr:hypothetical protein [Planctomycetales bacterium]